MDPKSQDQILSPWSSKKRQLPCMVPSNKNLYKNNCISHYLLCLTKRKGQASFITSKRIIKVSLQKHMEIFLTTIFNLLNSEKASINLLKQLILISSMLSQVVLAGSQAEIGRVLETSCQMAQMTVS